MTPTPLIHGGNLIQASAAFGQPTDGWLDLSTGINPYAYPVPAIPNSAWRNLPYISSSTLQAACAYYGTEDLLLTAGSQPVIEKLPHCLHTLGNQQTVLIPDIGYQEHRQSWENQGNVVDYAGLTDVSSFITQHIAQPEYGHLVLINPNNPTGITYAPHQIATWAQQLAAKQGFVVVDEAFVDTMPNLSVLGSSEEASGGREGEESEGQALPDNVIVLRSFGKFFGLAGIRMGALIAAPKVLNIMAQQLGTWGVNGPAQAVACAAWQDITWQTNMRQRLLTEALQQTALWQKKLTQLGAILQAQTPLFRSFTLPKTTAQSIYRQAAQQGILLRLIPMEATHSLLRIGNVDLLNAVSIRRCRDFVAHIDE